MLYTYDNSVLLNLINNGVISPKEPEIAYCGNSIVEPGEECDEGLLLNNEGYKQGLCCDDHCKLTPGSECSDKNSDCCQTCRIAPSGHVCKGRDQMNCRTESRCDGDNT